MFSRHWSVGLVVVWCLAYFLWPRENAGYLALVGFSLVPALVFQFARQSRPLHVVTTLLALGAIWLAIFAIAPHFHKVVWRSGFDAIAEGTILPMYFMIWVVSALVGLVFSRR